MNNRVGDMSGGHPPKFCALRIAYLIHNYYFRQICCADFIYSRNPCLSLCMFPVSINACSQVAKKRKQSHEIEHLQSNGEVPFFHLTIFKVRF